VKLAIVGSRNYPRLSLIDKLISQLPDDVEIVSGGARGVDRRAAYSAQKRGLKVTELEADWENLGKRAGYLRNVEIVNSADRVVAFWDGVSPGTKHSMRLAKQTGKPLTIYGPEGERIDVGEID
jgi:hypothetical protein